MLPEPSGVHPGRLAELITGLDEVVGAALTEHAPLDRIPSEEDVIRTLSDALIGAFWSSSRRNRRSTSPPSSR